MLARHFSDETLLAYRDGELPLRKRWAVSSHLLLCWVCSARLAAVRKQVHSTAKALCDPFYPGHDRIQRAKKRFEERRKEYEVSVAPKSASAAPPRAVLVFAAAFLAFVSTVVWFGVSRRNVVPGSEPARVLAAIAEAEVPAAAAGKAVHQRFQVEVVSTPGGGRSVIVRFDGRPSRRLYALDERGCPGARCGGLSRRNRPVCLEGGASASEIDAAVHFVLFVN